MRSATTGLLIAAVVHAYTLAMADPKPADLRPALDPLARSLIDGEYCAGLVVALIPAAVPPQLLAWGETARSNEN